MVSIYNLTNINYILYRRGHPLIGGDTRLSLATPLTVFDVTFLKKLQKLQKLQIKFKNIILRYI
jgi:hypothetical protein